jgi:hypothetical protein
MFHVVDTEIFDRPLLDELCRLTTVVRSVAKSRDGTRFLQELLPTTKNPRVGGSIPPLA